MVGSLTFLGTGGSFGVPIIGCKCASCVSTDPRDNRLRASILLEWEETRVLVDAGPDLRQQALRSGISHIDEAWLTHGHADHTNGIDDLRVFCFGGRVLPVRGSSTTLAEAMHRFSYAFRTEIDPSGVSHPLLNPVPLDGRFQMGGREIVPLPVSHGPFEVTGFRVGDLAYVTDVSHIPESTFALLEGVKILILSALREEPHPTHLTFDQAIEIAQRVGAEQTWFTHFAHGVPHVALEARFPATMRPAYDGLKLSFS
jgi:phosphoribosyl 1,2-cyclic phosphate phosphodiesterase